MIIKQLEKECFKKNKKFRCVFLDSFHWEYPNTGYYKCRADHDVVQCDGFCLYCSNYSYISVQLELF